MSSVSSATSSSSSAHSVDSDDMYADLASPVSSASSRSPTPAQTKKEKGRCPQGVPGLGVPRGEVVWADDTSPRQHAGNCLTGREAMRGRFSLTGKSKKEDGVKVDKRKRDSSTQPPKPSRTPAGGRSSQQPTTPQQVPPGQPPAATFIAHKEIKLTLLNKVGLWAVLLGPQDPWLGQLAALHTARLVLP